MAQHSEPDPGIFDDVRSDDIGSRSVKGGVVTVTSQAIKFALQTASTMVLARLLLPSDFGMVAMVTAVVGFFSVFKDAGLSTATIQRSEITHRQVSALFWINVALSFLLTVAAVIIAPLIAWFYDEPRLFGICFGYAAVILFGGLGVQHQALLRRRMRFKTLAAIEILSLTVGVAVGIGMGVRGAGYWSIVGMHVSQALSNALLTWTLSGWLPGWPQKDSGVRPLISFGLGLTGATFFNIVREQLPFLIIGKMLGSGPLAIFERAYKLMVLPLNHMMPPISAVALPALSRISGDSERIRQTGRKLFLLISGTTVPLSVIAVLTAPELIEIFLGDQWRRAGVIFALLSPLAATQAISSVAFWLLTACGQSKILFRFSAINALMAAASVWVGVQYSLEAGALAFSGIGLLVRTPLLYAATVAHTPISWNDLLGNAGLLILSGLLLGASGLLIRYGVLELTYPSYIWAAVAAGVVALTWIPVAAAQGLPAMLRQLYATLRST